MRVLFVLNKTCTCSKTQNGFRRETSVSFPRFALTNAFSAHSLMHFSFGFPLSSVNGENWFLDGRYSLDLEEITYGI
jgi:hypothetical protein